MKEARLLEKQLKSTRKRQSKNSLSYVVAENTKSDVGADTMPDHDDGA